MTESLTFPNPSAKAGFLVGLELCSKVLWDTAVNIKDDQFQGYSERLAVIKVLKEIHEQIQAEVDKFNAKPSQPPV